MFIEGKPSHSSRNGMNEYEYIAKQETVSRKPTLRVVTGRCTRMLKGEGNKRKR